MVRLAGIALVPPLIWVCIAGTGSREPGLSTRFRRALPLAAVISVSVLLIAFFFLRNSFDKYVTESMLTYVGTNPVADLVEHFIRIFVTIAEMILNVPFAQFRTHRTIFFICGIIGSLLILAVISLKPPRGVVRVYLISYVALLILWPYDTPRLWMPMIPLVIAYAEAALAGRKSGAVSRVLVRAYLVAFALTGVAALAYTTRVTLSGSRFSKVYGRAGGMSVPNKKTGMIDTVYDRHALLMMKRYGNPF
jgi:hypothetical protein